MLELIKVIIEPIAKSLSVTAVLEARKTRKAHEIGTELFLFYAALNETLVVGRNIVGELERACTWMEQQLHNGEPDRCYSSPLGFLLRQQSFNVMKLVASIKRLGLELQVIAPEAYVKLSPLIHGKFNTVNRLMELTSGAKRAPGLVSVDCSKLQGRLAHALAILPLATEGDLHMRACGAANWVQNHVDEDLNDLLVAEPIEDIDRIPAKQFQVIRDYLDIHAPAKALDDIEGSLKILRDGLESNFSLRDILLNVGDRRSALEDERVWL